jgi:ribosomal 30S subunit maturation factor RimM
LRKPHGQHGEVSVVPLVETPGAVLQPKAQLWIVDEDRRVLAGPLVLTRRRAYHREWLIGFAGLTSRDAVDGWRDRFVAVPEDDAGG